MAERETPGRVGRGGHRVGWCAVALAASLVFFGAYFFSPELSSSAVRLRRVIEGLTGWDVGTRNVAGDSRREGLEGVAPATLPRQEGPAVAVGAAPVRPEPRKPVPVPPPPPEPALPQRYIPYGRIETARIFNGVHLEAKVATEQGSAASKERDSDPSYRVALDVRVNVPTPVDTLAGLARLNPSLPAMLPGLGRLMPGAKVSDFFHGLYERKVAYLHDQLARLDQMVSRHNFYDCETILELKDPGTGRRVLLVQGEMDVVSDGSDGDRGGAIAAESANYQPFTSYRWKKRTDRPNPFLADRKRRLAEAEREFAIKGLSVERNRQLRATIDQMRREIGDLERYSFLVAELDPFVVLPGFVLRYADHPYAPRFGDLAVVIHGGRAYPALLGDAGPSYKSGEASLRIARAIDPRSDPYRRPVAELTVSYLVFPRTAFEPAGPPDLARLRARCIELLDEIGGFRGEMHDWAPPPPPPAVTNAAPPVTTNAPPPATNAAAATTVTNAPVPANP